jgi:hypothetical protein
MMTHDLPQDLRPEIREEESVFNGWPVNMAAKRMLIEAGETPDPASLYIFQLALWAVKTDKTETEDDVRETINAMTTWRSERIANFFMLGEDCQEYDPPGWKEAGDPPDLAALILDDIEKKMVIHFPWYRSFQW